MAEDTRNRPDNSSDSYSSKPASDPLAELARLIGQGDPFADAGKRPGARKPFDSFKTDDRPAPEWLARPASPPEGDDMDADVPRAAPRQDYAADYRADPYDVPASGAASQASHDGHTHPDMFANDDRHTSRYAEDRYAPDDAAQQPPAGAAYAAHESAAADYSAYPPAGADDRYRVALPAANDYEPDSYYADDGHLPPQGEEGAGTGRRRGGILTIMAVFGLAVIGTAGAFGYRAFTSGSGSSGAPPIIKADTTPAKTVPPAPPSAPAADAQSKPFQDRVGGPATAERVVPREEQPVALPVAPTPPRVTAPLPSAQAAAPLVAPAPPSVNEPKRVRTLTIRPDASDTTATTPGGPAPSVRSAAPNTKQSSGPMAIAPQSDSARTKVATRTPPVAASGAYVVQVSAQKTEAEAQSSYRALQTKYPSVLSGRDASIRRADLGDKGVYYRAQIGPFATADQANAFCGDLKAAGGQCIVQKN